MARQLRVHQRHLLVRLLGPRGTVVLPTVASVHAAAEPRVPAPRTGVPESQGQSLTAQGQSPTAPGVSDGGSGGATVGDVTDPAAEDRRRARIDADCATAVRLAAEVARGMHRGFARH